MKAALVLCLLVQASGPVTAADVQTLLDAGRYDEAARLLPSIPLAAQERLAAMIALGRGQPAEAVVQFKKALARTPNDARLALYLSHALLLTGHAAEALTMTERATSLANEVAYPLLRSRALVELDRAYEAYDELARAHQRLGYDGGIVFELARLAQSFGLTHAALTWAAEIPRSDREHGLALFHVFYGTQQALPLLESIAAAWPSDAEIQSHLAISYGALGAHSVAAKRFAQADRLGAKTAFDAAEHYRVAGAYHAALQMNAAVEDDAQRQAQRVSILFDRGSYARVLATGAPVTEADTYRFAYANFALGQMDRAASLARQLLGTPYDAQARLLLTSMGRPP